MNKSAIIISCLFFVFQLGFTQNTKRAYRSLEKNDLEKAYEQFNILVAESPKSPAARFGLVVLYSTKSSPYFDILKAKKNADIVLKEVDKMNEDDEEVVREYFMNTEERSSSRPPEKKMKLWIEQVESDLIKYIREENNLELANRVIEEFPELEHYDNVVHIRNHLEFRKAEKTNTIEAYNQFIETYPNAAQVPKAIKQRNALAFEKAKATNTVKALNEFIQQYPNAQEVNKARMTRNKIAFKNAERANTLAAIETFIETYPDALEVAEAKILQKQLVYEKAKKIRTLEAYNEFIKKYPEGQMYIDIFNLKANDLGQQFLAKNPQILNVTNNLKVYDNNFKADYPGDAAINSNGQIILAGNSKQGDTVNHTDPWLIGLDSQGEMLWNKSISYPFTDLVLQLELTDDDEIICAGVTNKVHDTLPGEPWLFKLGNKGEKIWNRTLRELDDIQSFGINSNNMIIITGNYMQGDTLQKHCVIKIDQAGKKRWKRTYVEAFQASDIHVLPNNDILVVTSGWIYGMDPQGYILWEHRPDTMLHALQGITGENGEYYVTAINKSNQSLELLSYDVSGKLKWQKSIGTLQQQVVYDLISVNDKIFIAAPFAVNNNLVKLDSQGNTVKSWKLQTTGAKIKLASHNNQLIILTGDGDLILMIASAFL